MPDPVLYLKSMGVAAIVSAIVVLAMAMLRRTVSSTWLNSASVLAMGLGLALGCNFLEMRWTWPPVKGLDRLLMIVMPMALGIELIAGLQKLPQWVAWFLRLSLAAVAPRILLHGSVHLAGSGGDWTRWEGNFALLICGALLAFTWGLLGWLSQRSGGISIPIAVSLTTQCAGLTVMLAGYLKGGATAFPLAATIISTAIATKLVTMRSGTSEKLGLAAIIGVGVIGLFGVLMIGRFFGRLSTGSAVVLMLAPVLCWATELPFLRGRKSRLVGSLRLVLVSIPLVVVLAFAKRDFDRDMAPLLGEIPARDAVVDTPIQRTL